ncbi:hypothetical protein [Streptomyces uncialis]|uniref:hypothetical protein n=1 Tax=Streptomyces uncialis TaxID=1048205 RepID=UPI0033E6945B
MSVPVRLATLAAALAATAGCVSVGDEAARPGPSHSSGPRDGEGAQPGGAATTVDGGYGRYQGGRDAKPHLDGGGPRKKGASPSAPAPGSDPEPGPNPDPGPGPAGAPAPKPDDPRPARPTQAPRPTTPGAPTPVAPPEPTPTRVTPAPEPPKPTPEPPAPEPTPAEPSSSAHEEPPAQGHAARMFRHEPSPEAGSPV